jgi:hypothetical protein
MSRQLENYDFCALVEELKHTYPYGVVPILTQWAGDPIIKVLTEIAGFRRVQINHGNGKVKAYLAYGDISDDQVREVTDEWRFIGMPVNPKRRVANI